MNGDYVISDCSGGIFLRNNQKWVVFNTKLQYFILSSAIACNTAKEGGTREHTDIIALVPES